MSTIRKPMKAEDFIEEKLRFPYLGSYKVDGYRSFIDQNICRMSSGKEMPNDSTRNVFSHPDLDGLDGEMVVGPWNRPDTFRRTSSALRRKADEPRAILYTFDDRSIGNLPYRTRYESIRRRVQLARDRGHVQLGIIEHILIRDMQDLLQYENEALMLGFEGIMLNDPEAMYKNGRSTVLENIILKVKRMTHEEARIIGFTEQMENISESFLDDLGRSKKSYKKEDLVGAGMVGSFIVQSSLWPTEFSISASSLTHDERKDAYDKFEEKYSGQLARFSYFARGVVDVPRHGVFNGLRDVEDL
jgi:DNA ligase-1